MTALSRQFLALLVAALPSRSAAQTPRLEFTEVHLGVATRIVVHADPATARDGVRAAFARIAALEDVMSDWRPESEVSRLSSAGGRWAPVSAELFAVLEGALDVARATDGAFDPTVGPYVALWREARRTGKMPAESALVSARQRVGWRLVTLDTATRSVRLGVPGMQLDLGGVAKGFILGRALAVLRTRGIDAALIEAGGDVVTGDPPPGRPGWIIEVAGAERVRSNVAVSTSGTGEQFVTIGGRRYAHVVDPRTGLGVTVARTVTVVAADAALADALATALVVLGPAGGAGITARFADVSVTWRE